MKFRYKKYPNSISRPIIPIKLKSKEHEIGYEVLVDSGADLCIFHAEMGESIGGKASFYYLHKISIEVGGWFYDIEAGFMPNVAGKIMPYGLVGQKGFFDIFIVKFDLLKGEIDLKPRFKKNKST